VFIVLYFVECIVMFVSVLMYLCLACIVSVCVFTRPGKNGYADWLEFKL